METGLARNAYLFVVVFYCWFLLIMGQEVTNTTADLKNNSQKVTMPTPVSKLTRKTAQTKSTVRTTASTASASSCQYKHYEECPDKWVLTNDDRCVWISKEFQSYLIPMPSFQDDCRPTGGYMVANVSEPLRQCLLRVMGGYIGTSILLKDSKVMSLETGVITPPRPSYYRYQSLLAHLVCFIDRASWGAPKVTSFQLNITDPINGTWRQVDLLDTANVTLVEEPEDLLTFTCQVSGNTMTDTRIFSYNGILRESSGSYLFNKPGTLTVSGATCEHSGVYRCVASNPFGSVNVMKEIIVKHTLEFSKFHIHVNSFLGNALKLGFTITLHCSVNACPPPKLLTIEDYTHTSIASSRNSSDVFALMSDIRCSDSGAYFCVAEGESGSRVEKRTEVVINDRCPVQLCRGEHESSIVPAELGQTFNISLCLMSNEPPSFVRQPQDKRLSVNFTRAPQSLVIVQAHVTIANLSDSDYRTYTLGFKNVYGTLFHNLTIIPRGMSACPSDITETSHGTSYISLSWKHRFAHSYHVFFSSNNMTWNYSPVGEGVSSTTITGLVEDTKYYFRIAALLPPFQVVDENSCVLTAVFKTDAHADPPSLESASESKRTQAGSQPQPVILSQSDAPLQESHGVLITTLPLVVVNMALIIVFAGFIYWKRGRLFQNLGSNKTTGHAAGPNFGIVNDQFESNSLLGTEHSAPNRTPRGLMYDTEL